MSKSEQATRAKLLLKVLRLLAEEKEYGMYRMPKALNVSYRTLLRYLKTFEEKGFVKVRTELSEKGGKDRKIYTLTIQGLMFALPQIRAHPWKKFEKVIYNYPDSFLAFKKYPLFKKLGAEDFFAFHLQQLVTAWFEREAHYWAINILRTPKDPQKFANDIDTIFFGAAFETLNFKNKQLQASLIRFREICREDTEIRPFVEKAIARDESLLRERKAIWKEKE